MDELLDRDEVVALVNLRSAFEHSQCSTDDNASFLRQGCPLSLLSISAVEIETLVHFDHLAGNSLSIFRDRICCITILVCINFTYLADDSGSINLIRCIFTCIDEFESVGYGVRFFLSSTSNIQRSLNIIACTDQNLPNIVETGENTSNVDRILW